MSFLRREYERSRKGFLQAWVSLFLAFPLGVPTVFMVGQETTHLFDPRFVPSMAPIYWSFPLIFWSTVGGPFYLLARRFIVRPTFPFLRLGFASLLLVVPALWLACDLAMGMPLQDVLKESEGVAVFLGIILLIGTLLFVAIARPMGGFGDEWPGRIRAKGL